MDTYPHRLLLKIPEHKIVAEYAQNAPINS